MEYRIITLFTTYSRKIKLKIKNQIHIMRINEVQYLLSFSIKF